MTVRFTLKDDRGFPLDLAGAYSTNLATCVPRVPVAPNFTSTACGSLLEAMPAGDGQHRVQRRQRVVEAPAGHAERHRREQARGLVVRQAARDLRHAKRLSNTRDRDACHDRDDERVWPDPRSQTVRRRSEALRLHSQDNNIGEFRRWIKRDEIFASGFDNVIDYRNGDVRAELPQAAPDGIDLFFDNVGGWQMVSAFHNMKIHGRISMCGAVSNFGTADQPSLARACTLAPAARRRPTTVPSPLSHAASRGVVPPLSAAATSAPASSSAWATAARPGGRSRLDNVSCQTFSRSVFPSRPEGLKSRIKIRITKATPSLYPVGRPKVEL